MKKIVLYIFTFFSIMSFLSCEKELETENISEITYYADFIMNGKRNIVVNPGGTYVEPGVTASNFGVDTVVTISVQGLLNGGTSIDTSIPEIYDISYTASNRDNFKSSIVRTVFITNIGDFVDGIEGVYTAQVKRAPSQGAVSDKAVLKYIMIWKNQDNNYEMTDGIGGYYSIGRAYGSAYMASGATFTVNDIATNNVTYGPAFGVGAFGGAVVLSEMVFNAETKTITYTASWDSGYTFYVTLTQVQF